MQATASQATCGHTDRWHIDRHQVYRRQGGAVGRRQASGRQAAR